MNPVEQQILVVDADAAERTSIRQILAREGFQISVAADGPSALRQIDAKPFALVVAEIRLPGPLDGMTTMRLARARRPRLKCLLTSAVVPPRLWGDDELDDFIAKPLDRREFLGCVFELLERGDEPDAPALRDLEHSCA
jgi:DNA-binding response OmpR family regulator